MGPAEAEAGRRCRLIPVEEMAEINIDAQDIQDYLLMVWSGCSGTRVFTPLSSTITFS